MSFNESYNEASRKLRSSRRLNSRQGRWTDPSSLYSNNRSSKDDCSSEDDNDSAIFSDSTLDGMDIRSSNSSAVNSMMYSEDDLSAKSGMSCLDATGCSRRNVLGTTTKPLFMNVDMLLQSKNGAGNMYRREDSSSTSSDCDSKESSAGDHYFQQNSNVNGEPDNLLSTIVTDDSIDFGSENYIFTDDDDDGGVHEHSNHEADQELLSFSNGLDIPGKWREREWTSFHQRRGRLLAQQLLEQASYRSSNVVTSSSNSSLTDKEESRDSENSSGKYRPSFLSRAVRSVRKRVGRRRRFFKSSSPLDKARCEVDWNKQKNNIDSRSLCRDSSAATTRNELANFGSWEACVRYKSEQLFSLEEVDNEDTASSLEDTSVSSQTRDDPFMIRAVSSVLLASNDDDDFENEDEMIIFRDLLDNPRATSKQIATSLGIEQEAEVLLHQLQSASEAVVVNEEHNSNVDDDFETPLIPLIHLSGNLWLPQYEEYVFRSIHTFSSRLLNSIGHQITMLLDE